MLQLRLGVGHPIKRRVALAAATEVRPVVIAACPARVGVISQTYGYALVQSAANLQYQVQPIKSWFHFTQSSLGNHISQQSDPCCTYSELSNKLCYLLSEVPKKKI